MSARDDLQWLFDLQKFGMKLGLENSRHLSRLLGHPEQSWTPVLVAGTNGKGSVAAMLEAILSAAGLSTGLFTSPHLVRAEERIRLSGSDIPPGEFREALASVRETIEAHAGSADLPRAPTFFETMTAMALLAFARRGVDVGVLEVGLGGRFDATNIVSPVLSAVCSVDLDHQQQLGSGLASIAREKAGVFRAGRPALIAETKPEAREALIEVARDVGARLIDVPAETEPALLDDGLDAPRGPATGAPPGAAPEGGGRLLLDLQTPVALYTGLAVPLPGAHQARNVALAVRAAEILLAELRPAGPRPVGEDGTAPPVAGVEEAVRRGLAATRWPGRLEWVPADPPLLLDCAHNPAGAATLADALRRIGPERCVLLFAAMHDKDHAGMARALAGCARAVVATRPALERAAAPEDLLGAWRAADPGLPAEAVAPLAPALERARALAGAGGIVCVAGSVFLVGEVKEILERAGPASGCS